MDNQIEPILPFPKLQFPDAALKITSQEGKYYVFDFLRKKNLALTPEEWVRQHVVHWLIKQGYPKGFFSLENSEKQTLQKRYDLVVFDRNKKPFLLVECKASNIRISSQTFQQILAYNLGLEAPYLMLTNGLKIFLLQRKPTADYESIQNLPPFPPTSQDSPPSHELLPIALQKTLF
jgi:hypothetical protein